MSFNLFSVLVIFLKNNCTRKLAIIFLIVFYFQFVISVFALAITVPPSLLLAFVFARTKPYERPKVEPPELELEPIESPPPEKIEFDFLSKISISNDSGLGSSLNNQEDEEEIKTLFCPRSALNG